VQLDWYRSPPRLERVGPLAAEVEDAGFGGLWLTETARNVYLAAGASVSATEGITVGTDIAVAFPRSPMVTAQAAWDLADASGGRFVLGLGSQVKGHVERRFSTEFSRPAARLREYVLALRAIFRAFQGEERLRFEGDFYRFSLLTDFFDPGPIDHPHVPIAIAAVNRRMAEVAGEVADGLCAHPLHTVSYLTDVLGPAVAAGAAAAGRSPGECRLIVPVFVAVGDGEEELAAERASIRRQIGFYGSTPSYRAVFGHLGRPDVADRLTAAMRAGDLDGLAAAVPDDVLDRLSVTATWDGLGPALVERYRGVADRVLPYRLEESWDDHPDRIERWTAVAAAVAEATT
jgi:probable F420-dependent oxidoreductase